LEKRLSVIVDIDDTLLEFKTNKPIKETISYVKSLGDSIVIVTGRNNSERDQTIKDLEVTGIDYTLLLMNPGNPRDAVEFKRKVGETFKLEARLAIENNANARAAYESVGIKTLDPAELTR
jgi:hydroxymethylpyrimidine pyrophosphatase-like HAD family hydrolase